MGTRESTSLARFASIVPASTRMNRRRLSQRVGIEDLAWNSLLRIWQETVPKPVAQERPEETQGNSEAVIVSTRNS